jgi:uncharacterized metal-binding protein
MLNMEEAIETQKHLPWIFQCSGSSNVGQAANDACKLLYWDGKVKIGCIAAIGAHIESLVIPNRSRRVICVDGCMNRCAFKTLEQAQINPEVCIIITELGIKKSMDMKFGPEEVQKVKSELEKHL